MRCFKEVAKNYPDIRADDEHRRDLHVMFKNRRITRARRENMFGDMSRFMRRPGRGLGSRQRQPRRQLPVFERHMARRRNTRPVKVNPSPCS